MRLRGLHLIVAAVGALAGSAGCAGSQKSADAGYVTVCSDEARTGTFIARTRCERRYDQQERSRRDQAHMQHIQSEMARRKIVEETPKPKPTVPQQRIVLSKVRQSGTLGATQGQSQKP